MAFTEDAVKAKLSALNETQDSIVSVAQWILFHRRHAPVTAKIWQARLGDSLAPKRLNLIYLANEVIQQSKARKKDDFLLAFSPIIADATVTAFKGASGEIQQKIRRVVDVWRQRNIFDPVVQEGIEKRVDAIESGRRKPMLGGSLFGGGSGGGQVAAELGKLAELQTTVTKSELAIKPAVSSSLAEYKSLIAPDADSQQPTTALPKQAAQLAALQKSLASASDAVSASIAARKALVAELSRLVEQHQEATRQEEEQLKDLSTKRPEVEERRRHVEDQIMRGLGEEEEENTESAAQREAQRPEMEPLTPPPMESFTPPPAAPPPTGAAATGVGGIDGDADAEQDGADGSTTPQGDPSATTGDPRPASSAGTKRESSAGAAASALNGAPTASVKRRKMSHQAEDGDEVYAGLEDDELDDEVKGLLA